ncbi:DUF6915 family protein [Solidesulfovibrio fructosivorans]|uniref:DUF6915 family protein n=1 Tax=Solidesulfovibrio fructosivorans TaxID=878 RepID=UPI001180B913|nr:hypothetical protein [Solidesulfovibrio fructosivorans]
MHIKEHEEHCLKVLGSSFTEIHEWMDQYYEVIDNVAHRVVLHHQYGIELGVSLFGEPARKALELHVVDDFEFIPDTPEDVAQMMRDQDFLTPSETDILIKIIGTNWPDMLDQWNGL